MSQVEPGRYGLIGLNERAKLLGGVASLASAPQRGTRFRVVIPLEGRLSTEADTQEHS